MDIILTLMFNLCTSKLKILKRKRTLYSILLRRNSLEKTSVALQIKILPFRNLWKKSVIWKLHTKDKFKICNKCWWTNKGKEALQEKTLLAEIKCWTYKSNLNKLDRRLTLQSLKNLIFSFSWIELTVKNGLINLKMLIRNFKTLFSTRRLSLNSSSQITRTFRTFIPILKTNSARLLNFLHS